MESPPLLRLDASLAGASLRCALVTASGLVTKASAGPSPRLAALLERVRAAGESWLPEARKKAVRDLLRHGAYKPAGRAKPSSEYLVAAALEGSFPLVNGPVDANNAVSLEFGLPASVFDLAKVGPELLLRRGGPGDSYVFNASGQSIALEDLLCVWRRGDDGAWLPTGNPVKDAMDSKVFEGCGAIVALVYAPAGPEGDGLEASAERYTALLREDCGAIEATWSIIQP